MSGENVDLVRRCVTARDRGDYSAARDLVDPEVVVDLSVRPDGRVYNGRLEAARALEAWVDLWDEYRYVPEQFLDAGDRVVVLFRESGRGRESGVPSEMLGATVWTIRDGKVVHTKVYADREQALEDVGLQDA
jgi:ketosteroid isomerase-like protein